MSFAVVSIHGRIYRTFAFMSFSFRKILYWKRKKVMDLGRLWQNAILSLVQSSIYYVLCGISMINKLYNGTHSV